MIRPEDLSHVVPEPLLDRTLEHAEKRREPREEDDEMNLPEPADTDEKVDEAHQPKPDGEPGQP
jgi:hypothetical protein